MEIKLNISELNECNARPFWIIIDPEQNFTKGKEGINNIASMITGLFFSREEAQEYLSGKSYHFSKNARVYCHSAVDYGQYSQFRF